MRSLRFILGAVFVVFMLKFGAACLFLWMLAEEQAAETADSGIVFSSDDDDPADDEDAPTKAAVDFDKPAKDGAKPVAKPRSEPFLKRLPLPDGKNGDDATPQKSGHVHALSLDPAGTRVVAVSQHNTWCLDVATGKVLQTFQNELPTNNPRPQLIGASRDARFVIIPSVDGKDVTVREASTGKVIGTCHLTDTNKFNKFLLESRLPAMTPAEDYLLVGTGVVTPGNLHALSTKTGKEKLLDVPRIDFSKQDYEYLIPIPQSSTFLVYGTPRVDRKNPSNLFAVDFSTGKETALSCLHGGPHFNGWRPLVLSPDGSLLLVKGLASVEVCDWRANRLVFHYEEKVAAFDHACFTPDGKRVAFIRRANGVIESEIDPQTGKWVNHRIDDVVHLFDIATQEKIATYTPHADGLDSMVRALALSHDGKSFAVWTGNEVTLIDFRVAFGVAPLPPGQRLEGPESLPLKQLTEVKDSPKKPK
jgi:WD40 repeat protein